MAISRTPYGIPITNWYAILSRAALVFTALDQLWKYRPSDGALFYLETTGYSEPTWRQMPPEGMDSRPLSDLVASAILILGEGPYESRADEEGTRPDPGVHNGDAPMLPPDDIDDIDGIDIPMNGVDSGPPLAEDVLAAGVIMPLSRLAPFIPAIVQMLRRWGLRVVQGMRIPWDTLPGWLQRVLVTLGLIEGADLLIDIAMDNELEVGGFPLPFFGGDRHDGDPTKALVDALTVSTWNANGVTFHRLSDGRLATRNKHGVWKIWRPKKPVVLFATGNRDLQDILRADAIIDKEARKMAKTLGRRGYQVRKKVAKD